MNLQFMIFIHSTIIIFYKLTLNTIFHGFGIGCGCLMILYRSVQRPRNVDQLSEIFYKKKRS